MYDFLGVSETSATGGSGGNTPGAKDQLMYLSQLLGFTVQFSDFPKVRNKSETMYGNKFVAWNIQPDTGSLKD